MKQNEGIFNIFAEIDDLFVSEIGILYDKGADNGRISEGVDLSIGEGIDSSVKCTDDADD